MEQSSSRKHFVPRTILHIITPLKKKEAQPHSDTFDILLPQYFARDSDPFPPEKKKKKTQNRINEPIRYITKKKTESVRSHFPTNESTALIFPKRSHRSRYVQTYTGKLSRTLRVYRAILSCKYIYTRQLYSLVSE